MAEIDVETIIYILFLALYGIYSLYKKSMKDAEKKYGKPVGDKVPSPSEERHNTPQKPEKWRELQDSWKELTGKGKSVDNPLGRENMSDKKIKERKKRDLVAPASPARERAVLQPSISEHTSFLPGDLMTMHLAMPEEGTPALYTQMSTHEIPYNKSRISSLPDDFDPRTAVMYSILLDRKEF